MMFGYPVSVCGCVGEQRTMVMLLMGEMHGAADATTTRRTELGDCAVAGQFHLCPPLKNGAVLSRWLPRRKMEKA